MENFDTNAVLDPDFDQSLPIPPPLPVVMRRGSYEERKNEKGQFRRPVKDTPTYIKMKQCVFAADAILVVCFLVSLFAFFLVFRLSDPGKCYSHDLLVKYSIWSMYFLAYILVKRVCLCAILSYFMGGGACWFFMLTLTFIDLGSICLFIYTFRRPEDQDCIPPAIYTVLCIISFLCCFWQCMIAYYNGFAGASAAGFFKNC